MGFIQKLFGIEKIQKKGFSFPGMFIGSPSVYLDWGKESTAYADNDTIYTVVRKIARKAATVPLYAYKPKNEGNIKRYKYAKIKNLKRYQIERVKALDEVIYDSDLARLLSRPNPHQGADAFFEAIHSFYVLRGEAFIWLNRGGVEDGPVLEMYVLPVDAVDVVQDPQDLYGIAEYKLQVSGATVRIPKADIIHWKTFNPTSDFGSGEHLRGFDPLKPLKRRIQQDNDGMDAAVSMFQNGGAKGVLFNETLDNLTPEQSSQVKGVIDSKVNNKAMKAAVAALQGKWGYVDLGLNSVDMELLKTQSLTMERIASALGIDPDILIPGQSFSNKEWAQKKFVTDLVIPMCNSLRDELNRVLVPSFREQAFIDYDFSVLPELQDDLAKMSDVWSAMFDRAVINGNEYRKLAGFEPTANPLHEAFLITGNYAPVEDLNMTDEELNEPAAKYNDYLG